MKTKHVHRGFTLIEALVYLVLFAIVIGGAIVSSYGIFDSIGRNETKAMLQEEGDFLVAKINWMLSGVQSVDVPAVGSHGPTLSTTKWDTSIVSPVKLTVNALGLMEISRGGNPAQLLANDNVSVTDLDFKHEFAGGTGPESVKTMFTLSARTPRGQVMTEDFTTTSYIRK